MYESERRISREAESELVDNLDPFGSSAVEGGWGVAQTIDGGHYPATSPAVFALGPADVIVAEEEGATPTFNVDVSVRIYAANTTATVPPVGTRVIWTAVGDRKLFEYYGPART